MESRRAVSFGVEAELLTITSPDYFSSAFGNTVFVFIQGGSASFIFATAEDWSESKWGVGCLAFY